MILCYIIANGTAYRGWAMAVPMIVFKTVETPYRSGAVFHLSKEVLLLNYFFFKTTIIKKAKITIVVMYSILSPPLGELPPVPSAI